MKTLLIILLFILFENTFIFSQVKSKVEVSKPYPYIKEYREDFFINNENVIALKTNLFPTTIYEKKTNLIQQINISKMYPTNEKEFLIPKNIEFEYMDKIGKKFCFFYSKWDKQAQIEQLFYQDISPEESKTSIEGTLLLKFNRAPSNALANLISSNTADNKFDFRFSSNKQKILTKFSLKSKENEANFNLLELNVFNSDLTKEWGKEIKMPYSEKKMDERDCFVDNDGNVFILARIHNDDSNKLVDQAGKPNFHLEVLKVDKNNETITKIILNTENKFITDLSFSDCTSDYIILAGFSYTKQDFRDADELVIYKIGKNGVLIDKLNFKLSPETQKANNIKTIIEDLDLKDLIVQEDKSILIIGEQYFSEKPSPSSTPTYNFWDIVFIKINTNGTLAFIKRIPKKQVGKLSPGGLSYKYLKGEKFHYICYLDNIKNIKLTSISKPSPYFDENSACFTACKIDDNDGKLEKIAILNTEDVNGNEISEFKMKNIVPISLNTFVFEAYKKKNEDILIKVTLP